MGAASCFSTQKEDAGLTNFKDKTAFNKRYDEQRNVPRNSLVISTQHGKI